MTEKVAKEMAEAEFSRFAYMMDLDIEPDSLDEEDRRGFETHKRRIVNSIISGAMVVNEAGEPVFTPQRVSDAKPITFREPTGAALMAMDRKKKNEDMGKMFATMASVTGEPSKTFAAMKQPDLRVCIAVVSLFLG